MALFFLIATRTPEMTQSTGQPISTSYGVIGESSAFSPTTSLLLHALPWLRSVSCVRARVSSVCVGCFSVFESRHTMVIPQEMLVRAEEIADQVNFSFCDHRSSVATIVTTEFVIAREKF